MDDIRASYVAMTYRIEVVSFNDTRCQDPALVGGKAATLARLYHRLGGTVPLGIVLPARQSAELANITGSDNVAEAAEAISVALEGQGMPMNQAYAVRSSALDEDSADQSFAGQYESVLGLASGQDILDAIGNCVRSAGSARVAAYRGAAIPQPGRGVPILIQQMVPADRAGVAFTVNPLTGAHEFVINASFGLGDLLVSGEITPDEIIVAPSGLVSRLTVGTKRLMSILTYRGTIRTPVPESLRSTACLSASQIDSVVNAARMCEATVGCPVDVEWALSGEKLFVLQARPITAISAAGADRHE